MPLIGVRTSWLIVVRNRDFASLAASARSRALAVSFAALSRRASHRFPRRASLPSAARGMSLPRPSAKATLTPAGRHNAWPRHPPNRRPNPSAISLEIRLRRVDCAIHGFRRRLQIPWAFQLNCRHSQRFPPFTRRYDQARPVGERFARNLLETDPLVASQRLSPFCPLGSLYHAAATARSGAPR